ncbi:hypothetical protein [Effusibacillus pohliae]|uniref:hypothetical protein n=1 Tax=Effusibacillus pohliae TaxID=232270 RepID=UPI00036322E8|nr:hypothetical protein [Effusibacillus pohliae]
MNKFIVGVTCCVLTTYFATSSFAATQPGEVQVNSKSSLIQKQVDSENGIKPDIALKITE